MSLETDSHGVAASWARSFMLAAFVMLVAQADVSAQERLLDFEMQDQFERTHRDKDFEGAIVLLIGSDRGGSEFNGSWGQEIREALEDHPRYGEISHLAVADTRGVPFFLKGTIRGKFPQNERRWVLMDWKGQFPKAYGFVEKSSNILVFAADGSLVHQASGREPDEETVDGIVRALQTLLDAPR